MKTSKRCGSQVSFYDGNTLIGTIDYSGHSDQYIEDAEENWQTGVLTEDIIEVFAIGENDG
jgi:hypothetical protein